MDAVNAPGWRGRVHGRAARGGADANLVALIVAGIALEAVFAIGFVWPLSLWDNPEQVPGHQGVASVLGVTREGATRFALAILAAFAAFAGAALVARTVRGRRGFWLVLAGTALFALTLLPTNPAGSQDIYHNIADGRTLWIYGDNPAVTAPDAHPDDPFLRYVPVWREAPTSYGPLWYVLSGAPLPLAGAELWPNVIGQKVLTAAFLLGTTALVMLVVGRIRPGMAAAAGVLVGWNPLLVFDTAGGAHNDIVMMFFALCVFYALARRWWAAVFPLLALAVSVKYVLLLLGPLLLLWMLRRRDIPRRDIAASLGLGAAVGLAIYVPFFVSGANVDAVTREGDHILASTGTLIVSYLMTERQLDVQRATELMKIAMVGAFGVGYVALLAASMRSAPSISALARTSAWIVFLFLVTGRWWFWGWYVAWLVPLAALAPDRRVALVASVFSASGMLMYVAYFWQALEPDWHGTQRSVFLVVFVVPLLLTFSYLLRLALERLTRAARTPAPHPG